jgi:hypothetical protein
VSLVMALAARMFWLWRVRVDFLVVMVGAVGFDVC